MRRSLAAVLLTLVACAGSALEPVAIIASSRGTLGTGPQRVLLNLIDVATNEVLSTPDREVTVEVFRPDGDSLGIHRAAFVWLVPDVVGLYEVEVDFPVSGPYNFVVDADGLSTSSAFYSIVADPSVPQVGEMAVPSQTRVAADYDDLSDITSDPDPDPSLYQMTAAEAVSNGTPAVLVFATPAFCQSQACGPMLDQVKDIKDRYPDVDFVHVEIYENLDAQSFDELIPVTATVEWGLPSEPWVFVVDARGMVASEFEGVVSSEALLAAIDSVRG